MHGTQTPSPKAAVYRKLCTLGWQKKNIGMDAKARKQEVNSTPIHHAQPSLGLMESASHCLPGAHRGQVLVRAKPWGMGYYTTLSSITSNNRDVNEVM